MDGYEGLLVILYNGKYNNSITHDWSDIDIEEELKWLKEENIGEDVRALGNEA